MILPRLVASVIAVVLLALAVFGVFRLRRLLVKRRPIRRVLDAVLAVAAALGSWAFLIEPSSLVVRHYPLALPGWPPALAGLRVAVLADLHVGSPFNGLGKLARIVETTNRQNPDLVLIPGDLVIQAVLFGRFVPPEPIAQGLGALRAPCGVFAVLGNHDAWFGTEEVRLALEAHGIPVLDDRAIAIECRDSVFWLAGVSDLWTGNANVAAVLAKVPKPLPTLIVTHNPDLFPRVPAGPVLTIAGHTHGGQVNLPILGRLVVPSQFQARYAAWHIVEDGRHLFVSTGLGTSILPVRFRVPPEISILELVPNAR